MSEQNPLQKYFRQPKMYVSLPSRGLYYGPGALDGDPLNVPIFAMTGMDEVIMKTPDALYNGEATVKLIESCCPYIKDAHQVPSLDIDVLLAAIRISTFGDEITVGHKCNACGEEHEYDISLHPVLTNYATKTFDNSITVDDLTVNFKPLLFDEMTKFNIENFTLQKMLSQVLNIGMEERQKHLDSIYEKLANIQISVFLTSIENIQMADGTIITDREFIFEWLSKTARENYAAVKDKLEKNKLEWSMPKSKVQCGSCGATTELEITLEQSNFFA